MFRWASPQPIPTPLAHLLEQAGGCRCGPQEAPDITLFLPPHLLLSTGACAEAGLGAAYAGFDDGAPQQLVNGERLLGRPLQRPLELAAVDPLLAAVTLAQLERRPALVEHYQGLDARSQRGGAAAEADYRQRLQPSPEALLAAWNQLLMHRQVQDAGALQLARQHLQELTMELEQQVIATHQARELAAQRQTTSRWLQGELGRLRRLLPRLMVLQGRVLPDAAVRR
jgi:hypothetical protein